MFKRIFKALILVLTIALLISPITARAEGETNNDSPTNNVNQNVNGENQNNEGNDENSTNTPSTDVGSGNQNDPTTNNDVVGNNENTDPTNNNASDNTNGDTGNTGTNQTQTEDDNIGTSDNSGLNSNDNQNEPGNTSDPELSSVLTGEGFKVTLIMEDGSKIEADGFTDKDSIDYACRTTLEKNGKQFYTSIQRPDDGLILGHGFALFTDKPLSEYPKDTYEFGYIHRRELYIENENGDLVDPKLMSSDVTKYCTYSKTIYDINIEIVLPSVGSSMNTNPIVKAPEGSNYMISGYPEYWVKPERDYIDASEQPEYGQVFEEGKDYYIFCYVYPNAGHEFPYEFERDKMTIKYTGGEFADEDINDSTWTGWYYFILKFTPTNKYSYVGEYQVVNLQKVTDLEFKFVENGEADKSFSKFVEARLDDTVLTKDKDYTVKEGSTIITLKSDFIKTLEEDEYVLTAVFEDGSSNASMFVIDYTPRPANNNQTSASTTTTNTNYKLPKTGVE